ncbi:hypothetical protein SAMN06272771_3039 [Streptomyces sp. Ag82_O1-12]|uniref:hypothetical protein n=1 Tax=unclassified Streptomyces TaxID=2593676 RepID=UPI000BCB7038|nr:MULTISPECIES: hypothetical protein [unclassified Streptomyces]SMQ16666.1 hypothetical protein SAMN06272771_3039 [Streptomyces sp. Ag82_O1-12]SOD45694.1 hypothetical protein SAMN06272727_3035 [Streptomyces sp. Ag82_G6-1]
MRVKEWREDAQPEWPEAATATGELRPDGRARDRRATQVFPGRDVRATGHGLPTGTEILRGIPRQSDGEADSRAPEPGSRTAVRDPWQEREEASPSGHAPEAEGHAPEADGQAHDPHEVTVQLDAVQLGEGFLRQVKEGPGAEAAADRPVFVDESGRRSRRYRRIGMAVALACGVYAVVIVATLLSGNSNAPWLPVPTKDDNPPAGQVDSPPLTAESAPTEEAGEAGGTGVTAPGSAPATGGATAPAPGPSAAAPGATAGPDRPGTSAKPSPTATRTTPAPGGKATDPAPTKPADPPSTPPTDPTPTGEPTAAPTETTGTGGDGGTVAEGPAEPQPVAETPAAA